jgi:DNA-binding SARP family transcriptional activator
VRVRLLGPVELVSAEGTAVAVPAGKRRAVLALLAMELNRIVPVERFFDLVWDGAPPPQARAALQGHIAGLRKLCDVRSFTLVTQAPGYLLRGEPAAVDSHEFTRLVGEADRSRDDEHAADLLHRALAMWRGSALMDVPEGELLRTLGADLDESRLRAVEALADRQLRLGRGEAALPALEQALRANELREPLLRALILCLHQAGRQSEALDVYHEARRRLSEELGVSPSAQLQDAFATVLRGPDASGRPTPPLPPPAGTPVPLRPAAAAAGTARAFVPQQLPRLPGGLVGRRAGADWLNLECGPGHQGAGLAVITGPAGTGKTAMVLRWAHSVAADFPDGQLFVDLQGFCPGAGVDPYEALSQFLRALGVPEDEIPAQPMDREDLFRSLTQSLRLLVVVDNAASADAVRPLIPAGASCSTVVTSRRVLGDLVVLDGAAALSLGPLSLPEALELVQQLGGAERVKAEPEMVRRLVDLCDRLPLALRIALARLTARPGWSVGDLVAELEDERLRLDTLDTAGGASVTAALAATYSQLPPDAARLLALLALHRGAEVGIAAAAALLGTGEAVARRALGLLSVYHLVIEASPGQYTRHDLVRLYSAQLLDSEFSSQQRAEALDRLLDYYLTATVYAGAGTSVHGDDGYLAMAWPPQVLPRFDTGQQRLHWFRKEEPTIRALVERAADGPHFERAWRLADNCFTLYHASATLSGWLAGMRAGLRAAERSPDLEARVRMYAAVGTALKESARPSEALSYLRRGLECGAQLMPRSKGRVWCLLTLAGAQVDLDDLTSGLASFELALGASRELSETRVEALTLAKLAKVLLKTGSATAALRRARQARALIPDLPSSHTYLSALLTEAEALMDLDRPEDAERCCMTAIERCQAHGHLSYQAIAERLYAELLWRLDRPQEAIRHMDMALELYIRRGDEQMAKRVAADIDSRAGAQPRGGTAVRSAAGSSQA